MWQRVFFVYSLALYAIGLAACSKIWDSYPAETLLEQTVEDITKEKSGIDVDLTPSIPDTNLTLVTRTKK